MKYTFSVPGRTELGGNHTDHQGGHVLASAVNILIKAEAEPAVSGIICVASEGYKASTVDLNDLAPKRCEKGCSSALIRGVAEYLSKKGYNVGGFNAAVKSDIPAGSGLSSSAAFEILVGRIISVLFNGGDISELELALAGRYAETEHFLKPCGLMDQCACACGGVIAMDFSREKPEIERIDADFKSLGYTLFITNTGGSHSDLTRDYAEITEDMKAAAAVFGKEILSRVDRDKFVSRLPEIRRTGKVHDRALLRALHYFDEDLRAQNLASALKKGNIAEYIEIMDESARSSAELLQNSFSLSSPHSQGINLALALSRGIHGRNGASRVHGGGFAGTIQALVPSDMASRYKSEMDRVFGVGSCIEAEIYCI
jgi:galactokinase